MNTKRPITEIEITLAHSCSFDFIEVARLCAMRVIGLKEKEYECRKSETN